MPTYTATDESRDLLAFVATRNALANALDTAHAGGFDRATGASNPATRGAYNPIADALIALDETGKVWFGTAVYVAAVGRATRAVA